MENFLSAQPQVYKKILFYHPLIDDDSNFKCCTPQFSFSPQSIIDTGCKSIMKPPHDVTKQHALTLEALKHILLM